jgi:pimeloyl-ACP methyl ester carboxylesterase
VNVAHRREEDPVLSETEKPRRTKKRTNVRFSRSAVRLAFRLLSAFAPSVAEERALALFGRPRRGKRPPAAPEVAALPSTPLRLPFGRDEIAVWQWGAAGDGPLVVLAHGWNGLAAQLSGFVAPLVAAGYRVVAYDQPAHGHSTGRGVTILGLRDALLVIDRALGPIHAVIAHSLGGSATVVALHAGLRLRRLVLLAPPVDLPTYARAFATELGLPPARVQGMLERTRKAVGGDLAALDLRHLAPRMTVPMLLVQGTEDPDVPYAQSQAIAAAWPGARLETVPGAGHGRPLRDPAVIETVVSFVVGEDGVRFARA